MIFADTETTGTGDDAEILEIAITDELGNVLLYTYITPTREWPSAQARNNISPEFIFACSNHPVNSCKT